MRQFARRRRRLAAHGFRTRGVGTTRRTRVALGFLLAFGALCGFALVSLSEKGVAQVAGGTIIIEKQTDPDGAAGGFTFTAERLTTGNFGLFDNGATTFSNVAPGTYNVREANPGPNFGLTSIQCDDGNSTGNLETRTATIRVQAGETVRCVFGNRDLRGRIIIEKQTDPDGAAGGFIFTAERLTTGSFGLFDNGATTFSNVAPGTYNVREANPGPNFGLTSIQCTDANSTANLETRTATIRVDPGETVRCVFTNKAPGRIIIEKQTDPDGAAGGFTFTAERLTTGNFGLFDNGATTFSNVAPGTYNVREANPGPNFGLTSIQCDDGNSTGNLETRTATIRVQAGETVRCVFGNRDLRGRIIIEKQTDPDGAAGGFIFTAERLTTGSFGLFDNGATTFSNVAPGTYNVREANPGPNFGLTSIQCTDANSTANLETRTATIRVDPGETVRCVFTNKAPGRIIIEKQTDPDGAAGGFTFTAERLTTGNFGLV